MSRQSPFARMDNLDESSEEEEEAEVENQDEARIEDNNQHIEENIQTSDNTEKLGALGDVSTEQLDDEQRIKAPAPPRPKRTIPPKSSTTAEADKKDSEKKVSFANVPLSNKEHDEKVQGETTDFWSEHDQWKHRVSGEILFVNPRVCEPETAGRSLVSLHPTVYYKIMTEDFDAQVRRRYSDFEWLQEILQSRFVGMVIPPLPPKVVGSGEHFLRLRMRGLSLFLQKIVQNPYLKSDQSVYSFFSESSSDQWDNIKKQTTAFEAHRDNTGHEKWLEALSRFELPNDSKTVLFELNRQVETLSRQLGKLLQAAQSLSAGVQHYSSSVVEFDHKFQDMLISEMISTNPSDENKLDVDDEAYNEQERNAEELVDSVRKLSFCARSWGDNVTDEAEIIDNFLLESIRFEHGLVIKLKELLKRRSEVIKLHDKSVQKKIIHEREKKVAEHAQQLEQVNKLARKIAEDNERVRNTYDHAIFITKGLFFSGARHFARVKAERLRRLTMALSTAFKSYHSHMQKIWSRYADKHENPDEEGELEGF